MVKIIVFVNFKGGIGKIIICINIVGCLIIINLKSWILVVDFDF